MAYVQCTRRLSVGFSCSHSVSQSVSHAQCYSARFIFHRRIYSHDKTGCCCWGRFLTPHFSLSPCLTSPESCRASDSLNQKRITNEQKRTGTPQVSHEHAIWSVRVDGSLQCDGTHSANKGPVGLFVFSIRRGDEERSDGQSSGRVSSNEASRP